MIDNPKLTNDVVFSFLMTSEDSEPVLKSFINAALEDAGRPLTKSVSILNRFSPNEFQSGKASILDVKAQDFEGRYFDIEMQTTNKKGFNNRILFYWSRLYSKQLLKGEEYARLNPVISIVIAQFMMFPQLEGMHNIFTLTSESNPKVAFSDQLQIHSIELPKADFTNQGSIHTIFSQWVDFFRNGHEKTEAEMRELLADEGLALAIEKYRALCQDPTLCELAMAQEKAERDRQAELDYALEEGLAKGHAKGLAEGRAEGRAEGLKSTIARRFSKQFPGSDASKIQQTLESVSDEERLNAILDIVIDSATEEEFFARVQQTL